MQICFATNNGHKLEEVRNAVGNQFEILSLKELSVFDDLPETQDTLEGNAIQKAHFVFEKIQFPCFADDSGLEVAVLNGAPGVYSARYAGPQRDDQRNIDLLLGNLQGKTNRQARFRTIFALVGYGPDKLFEGAVEGTIIPDRRGSQGFGYDPVFLPNGYNKTFAEMTIGEKNRLSHRAIALRKLTEYLRKA